MVGGHLVQLLLALGEAEGELLAAGVSATGTELGCQGPACILLKDLIIISDAIFAAILKELLRLVASLVLGLLVTMHVEGAEDRLQAGLGDHLDVLMRLHRVVNVQGVKFGEGKVRLVVRLQ